MHSPIAGSSPKLPSLQKRLEERLNKQPYMKNTKLLEQRKNEISRKLKQDNKEDEKPKLSQEERTKLKLVNRLQMLENTSIGMNNPGNSSNMRYSELIKPRVRHPTTTKNKDLLDNHIMLSPDNSIDSRNSKNEFKDSIDREIEHVVNSNRKPVKSKLSLNFNSQMSREVATNLEKGHKKSLINQLSLFSGADESTNSLQDTEVSRFNLQTKIHKPRNRLKRKMRKRRMNRSIANKTIEHLLTKKIGSANHQLDPAFRFYNQDIAELAEDPDFKRKLENAGDFISPTFLLGLKKKQRMQEYWKSRVKKDFTKLSKDSDEFYDVEPIMEKVPKSTKNKAKKTNRSPDIKQMRLDKL